MLLPLHLMPSHQKRTSWCHSAWWGQSVLVTQEHLESLRSPAFPHRQELYSLPNSLGPFCLLLGPGIGHATLQLSHCTEGTITSHFPTALPLLPTASFPPSLSSSCAASFLSLGFS